LTSGTHNGPIGVAAYIADLGRTADENGGYLKPIWKKAKVGGRFCGVYTSPYVSKSSSKRKCLVTTLNPASR
jgi:hypothetical protein